MKQPYARNLEEGSSFLEYFLLVALILAAAMAGMTFLGSTDDRHPNNTTAPAQQSSPARAASHAGPGKRVLPMVEKAGFDLIWFSIFIVLLVEIAELTPPLGFNIFVLQTMTGRDSNYVAWASLPFFFMMVLCVVLITVFPQLCTWLPDTLIGVAKK